MVLFFLPSLLAYGADDKVYQVLLKAESSFAIGLFVVSSCIVGTIIHHLEKNTYSYVLQAGFSYVQHIKSSGDRQCAGCVVLLGMLFMLIILALSYQACICLFFVVVTFTLVITLLFFLNNLVEITEKLWIISEIAKVNQEELNHRKYPRERIAILNRLDTWSDNIHCVQSCCFAWLLGLCFARYLVTQGEYTMIIFAKMSATSIEYSTVFDSGLAEAQLQSFSGWSTVLAFLLLFWEACFEWHRFQHIFHIVGSMEISFKKQNRQ